MKIISFIILMNNNLIIVFILFILFILLGLKRLENFDTNYEMSEDNTGLNNIDYINRKLAGTISESMPDTNTSGNSNNNSNNNYIRSSELERVARVIAKDYCPVSSDYNPDDYIKTTELKDDCPKIPDLNNYILRSAIKPEQKCPACVCPRISIKPNELETTDTCGKILDLCEPDSISESSPEYKSVHDFCTNFVKCKPIENKDYDIDTIRKNLLKDLNCPAPQPCSINKDIMNLLDNAIENNDSDILNKIKEKVNKININNVNINNLQNEFIKSKKEISKLLGIIESLKKRIISQRTTTTTTTTSKPTTTTSKPTTTSPPTKTTKKKENDIYDINMKNNRYIEQTSTTLPPTNINTLNNRVINMNTNGDSSGDEYTVYPSSDYDKCKSAPLKI